jgi:hypothetical protein
MCSRAYYLIFVQAFNAVAPETLEVPPVLDFREVEEAFV